MLVLSACGSESADEVYSEALSAAEDMESAEVAMDIEMNMEVPDEGAITIESSNDMEMTIDPLTMYMKGTTKFDTDEELGTVPGMGTEQEIEMYTVDDTMYMYNEMMGGWLKMEGTGMDAIAEMAGEQPDPAEQMKLIEDYVEDVSFDETDDGYTFKLETDGDEFKELFDKLMEDNQASELTEMLGANGQELLDNMDMNSLALEYTIDKDNYQIKGYNMDMDYTMEVEGQEMKTTQKMKTTYSNINNVDSIEVPEDVKEEAIDQGEMGF